MTMDFSQIPPGVDLCAIPAGVPPDGQVPNLVNPPSLTTATIVIGVLLTVWALVFVAIRVMVNRRKLSWADYIMAISMVLDIAYTAVAIAMSKYNRHLWDMPACWQGPGFMKLSFALNCLQGPTLYFSKTSIFLLYRELFSIKKSIKIAVYVGLAATFLTYSPYIFLSLRYISPAGGLSWKELSMGGNPADFKMLVVWGIAQGCLAVALDIYIFVLPLPTLARLHMSLKTRVQVNAVFATAFLAVIASIVALVYRVKSLDSLVTDPSWQQGAVYISILVENNVVIVVGSMPAVANFMRIHFSGTTIIKTMRSKIRRNNYIYSGKESKPSFRRPDPATLRSPNFQGPSSYELTDRTVTPAQVVRDEHGLLGRNHNAEYHQHYARPDSTDRLVL